MSHPIDTHALQAQTQYLLGYALRQVGDRDLAQDLVQDTLVAAMTSTAGFDGRSALRTWLVGILKHKILDSWRERSRAPESLDAIFDDSEERDTRAGVDLVQSEEFGTDPVRHLEHKRFWEKFQHELDRMPARMADAFMLSEFSGLSTQAVCESLGMSAGALWVNRSRARAVLRDALQPTLAF